MNRHRAPVVVGEAELRSPLFSNHWQLVQSGNVMAELHRLGRIYVTTADLADGGRLLMEPAGQGTVKAVDDAGAEVARIVRRSWIGRRWEITGLGYNYGLRSDPRPRRWHLEIANAPVTEFHGSVMSYNHVAIRSSLAVPVPAILLTWHVVARPWEAAAEPRGLIPGVSERPRT